MLLAATDPAASGGGPWGLLVFVLLGLATYFLIRNMTGRLKRLPPSFDPPAERGDEPPAPSDEPR